ncbi:MAG: hypothetical protein HWN80_20725, partial [Candidatus Lokiarchaeota archaeon]|nr:hypothetical protein [Candidatus Lokiarchaeota archaeon]
MNLGGKKRAFLPKFTPLLLTILKAGSGAPGLAAFLKGDEKMKKEILDLLNEFR